MKPDIIITWPRNCDYPLWRQMIRDHRSKFNEVIVVFMETNVGEDYRQFIKDAMFADHVLFVQSPPLNYGTEDWRNVSVNAGLLHSLHSEWIWFTEQDFFFKDIDSIWDILTIDDPDYIGVEDGQRLHPCCLFIKRSVLAKTSKNFSANPPEYDHFGKIQKDLELLTKKHIILLPGEYNHMAGLSHNMRLITDGQKPNHRVEEFNKYLSLCFKINVPIDQRFKALFQHYLNSVEMA